MTTPRRSPRRRLFSLPWRSRGAISADVDDELRFHLEARAAELVDQGWAPDAARAEALRQFGDVDDARRYLGTIDRAIEAAQRRRDYVNELRQDLGYAVRKLRSAPGFALTAVVTLALGIGAATAIFSVVNSVILKPLPFDDPALLMRVLALKHGSPTASSPPDFIDLRGRSHTFDGLAAIDGSTVNLVVGGADPELRTSARVSANFFRVMGARPTVGRAFVDGEDGPAAPRVAMLSDAIWRSRFNADPRVIGQVVRLDGESYTVAGVVPPGREYPLTAEIWMPLVFSPDQRSEGHRGARWLAVVGRLRAGVSVAESRRDVESVARALAREHPDKDAEIGATVLPLQEWITGDLRAPLFVMLSAVALVLVIACANVANLLLVRAAARESELAIRTAMGATRSRIVRQLVTESFVLSVLGAAGGLALAAWGTHALLGLAPSGMPRLTSVAIDRSVLLVAGVVVLLTGGVFGILPALHVTPGSLAASLRAGGRGTRTRRASQRAKNAIIVAEVALAVTLLAGAGMLVQSFRHLLAVDPGFRPENVLSFGVGLPVRGYETPEQIRQFGAALEARVKALPGVRSAGVTNALPLGGSSFSLQFTIAGRPAPAPGEEPSAQVRMVTPDFFRALSIPLLQGRAFTGGDGPDAPQVAIVSREFARQHLPGESPLGKRVGFGWRVNGVERGGVIVGVVGDVKQAELDRDAVPTAYLPYAQQPMGDIAVVVRTALPAAALAGPIRVQLRDLDRDLPIIALRTMDQVVATSVGRQRFYATLLTLFAAVALALAAVGLYGVIAYAVSQRTHELGVRVALGASRGRIARMVVGDGVTLGVAGVVLGVLVSLGATRVLRTLLFGISATDPLVLAAVAVVLVGVAGAASYLPARRAARVDPVVAIRSEGE